LLEKRIAAYFAGAAAGAVRTTAPPPHESHDDWQQPPQPLAITMTKLATANMNTLRMNFPSRNVV
jgi:hypothetical protein